MMRRARLLILTVAFVLACKDSSGPATPVPGTLQVQFTTTQTSDRAALIQLSGPGAIGNVQSASPGIMVFATEAGTSVKVIVTGSLTSGMLLRFDVPDTNKLKSYSASIVELSDAQNNLRADLSRHSVKITR